MEVTKEQAKNECWNEEDLGNYITQIVTDIGKNVNKDLFNKLAQAPLKTKFDLSNKKQRWKMASATNPYGIPSDEYSKFAVHVYQYLSYIKGLDIPTVEELREQGKLVDIDRTSESSKC